MSHLTWQWLATADGNLTIREVWETAKLSFEAALNRELGEPATFSHFDEGLQNVIFGANADRECSPGFVQFNEV